MAIKWDNEKELAIAVIEYLKAGGWTTYPEINGIDIVAVKADQIIGIECKKHFNLKVLDQAYKNRKVLNQTWVAVGASGWQFGHNFGVMVAKQNNIGVMTVSKQKSWEKGWEGISYKIHEYNVPELIPRSQDSVEKLIHPDAQNYAEAGQAGGRHWTRFTLTVSRLKEFIAANPGCKLSTAVDGIKHHYKSKNGAVGNLSGYIKGKVIDGIEVRDGGLFLTQPTQIAHG